MKVYTVYDNADGGYSIWYKSNNFDKKSYYAYNKKIMLSFCKKLENDGYKFVGKIL